MHFCIVAVLLHQRCRKSKVKHQQAVFILAPTERNQTSLLLPSPIRTRELCALPPPSVIWQVNVPSFSSVKWSMMNSMIPVETSWPILLGCRERGFFLWKQKFTMHSKLDLVENGYFFTVIMVKIGVVVVALVSESTQLIQPIRYHVMCLSETGPWYHWAATLKPVCNLTDFFFFYCTIVSIHKHQVTCVTCSTLVTYHPYWVNSIQHTVGRHCVLL